MTMIYVTPAPGGRVRQPERAGRVMPPEGAFVPRDTFYERLLLSGDVVEAAPPAKPAAANDEPLAADAASETPSRSRRANTSTKED